MPNWIVVPAAGQGLRVGGSRPKQYREIAGRSMLDWTLSRLLPVPDLGRVVVCIAAEDQQFAQQRFSQHPQVLRVAGGAERAESVMAGLRHVQGMAAPDDVVLVHDAARPLVCLQDVVAVINTVRESGAGAILAQAVADTLKRANAENQIRETLDRRGLWQAQTPQAATLAQLLPAMEKALGGGGPGPTDEAMALERAGVPVHLVAATAPNFKVTTAADLTLAAALLTQEPT